MHCPVLERKPGDLRHDGTMAPPRGKPARCTLQSGIESGLDLATNDVTKCRAFGCRDLDGWARKFRQNVRVNAAAVVVSELLAAETSANCQAGERPTSENGICHVRHPCCDTARVAAGDSMTLL